jgi:hypothetical protein
MTAIVAIVAGFDTIITAAVAAVVVAGLGSGRRCGSGAVDVAIIAGFEALVAVEEAAVVVAGLGG